MRDIDMDEAKEDGLYRGQRAYQRSLSRRDPFYPPELHEQDVRSRFGLDEFRWASASAKNAVISFTQIQVIGGMKIEEALASIIPKYSYNHENIPIWEIDNIMKMVDQHSPEKRNENAVHSTSR